MDKDIVVSIPANIRISLLEILVDRARKTGRDTWDLAGEYLQAGVEAERLARKPKA